MSVNIYSHSVFHSRRRKFTVIHQPQTSQIPNTKFIKLEISNIDSTNRRSKINSIIKITRIVLFSPIFSSRRIVKVSIRC